MSTLHQILILVLSFLITNNECTNNFTVPKLKMSNGKEIAQVGFGLWKILPDRWSLKYTPIFLRSFLGNKNPSFAVQVIKDAVQVGYRHFDSAWFYAIEEAFGVAIKELFAEGKVKREDLFITTKIWNTFHTRELVVENLKMSLKEMGLDYVDLALMHFPVGYKPGTDVWPLFFNLSLIPWKWEKDAYLETWKGMEDIHEKGLAKSIGVANFNRAQLKKVLDVAKIKPVMNQVECNPYYPQNKLLEFCKQNNVLMTAYSPLREAVNLLEDPVLNKLAQKHNKTAAQVALRWNVQRGVIVIPKTVHKNRMIENINILDFKLSDQEMSEINSIKPLEKLIAVVATKNQPDDNNVEE